jgi:predicted nucleotidyltransferase
MSDGILTWAERDLRRVRGHKAAVEAARAELQAYARAHGGRFVLFGSVARGDDRPGSDIDIMVDFPEHAMQAATEAEIICGRHGLKADIWPKGDVGEELMARIEREGAVLQ